MAGEKLILKARVDGSTVLEVLIAMIVIMIVFGLAMIIYSNVERSSVSVRQLAARSLLQDLAQRAAANPAAVSDSSFMAGEMEIRRTVKAYPGEPQLSELDLEALDPQQHVLATLKQVIIHEN